MANVQITSKIQEAIGDLELLIWMISSEHLTACGSVVVNRWQDLLAFPIVGLENRQI
ncbi:MAG: hypothetical protein ACI87E_000746 [Mariniblastus sp.]|jgi:hypothetical protein